MIKRKKSLRDAFLVRRWISAKKSPVNFREIPALILRIALTKVPTFTPHRKSRCDVNVLLVSNCIGEVITEDEDIAE